MTDLYDLLGIKRDATQDEIKKAYKSKAQQAHPDKEGGCEEKFNDIQFAYEVLSDQDRKMAYDETGESCESFFNLDGQEEGEIIRKFMQLLSDNSSIARDYPALILQQLRSEYDTIEISIDKVKEANEKMESLRDKIFCDEGEENLLVDALDKMLFENRRAIQQYQTKHKVMELAVDRIKKYGVKDMAIGSMFDSSSVRENLGIHNDDFFRRT